MRLYKNALKIKISTEQCMTLLLFTTLKSHEVLETNHSRSMASFAMPFSAYVCMCTKHLARKHNYSRLLN